MQKKSGRASAAEQLQWLSRPLLRRALNGQIRRIFPIIFWATREMQERWYDHWSLPVIVTLVKVHPKLKLPRSKVRMENSKYVQSASPNRVFFLSPAYAGGERARMIMNQSAQFDLAKRLRSKQGASIAEVFTFLSGLYFRGKIAYANAFACVDNGTCGVFVITPTRGLVDARSTIILADLREFAAVDIDETEPRYRKPLERSVRALVRNLPPDCEIVLLGSIATGKYVDVFLEHFRERLRFPTDFVGRGDMSRGGLLLRCAADRRELPYISVAGAVLNGKRPPKLVPRRYPKGWPSQ